MNGDRRLCKPRLVRELQRRRLGRRLRLIELAIEKVGGTKAALRQEGPAPRSRISLRPRPRRARKKWAKLSGGCEILRHLASEETFALREVNPLDCSGLAFDRGFRYWRGRAGGRLCFVSSCKSGHRFSATGSSRSNRDHTFEIQSHSARLVHCWSTRGWRCRIDARHSL